MIFSFFFAKVSSENYDDVKCDEQLNGFDLALVNHEFWALKCK